MNLKAGTLLQGGRYRIEGVIGSGGFGITYIGVQIALNRKVAIKEFFMKDYCSRDKFALNVIVPSAGSSNLVDRFKRKFIKEARTIAELSHENIIKIFDVFEENGTAYYVMEYLSGGSLNCKIPYNGMGEEQALFYIRQLADALGYIHDKKILHLDIKPSNLLLRDNGDLVLIDFGVSKHYKDSSGDQTTNTPVGVSDGYAPMEQYDCAGVATFAPSVDIYALGATLYCMLNGKCPPKASSVLNQGLPKLEAVVSNSTWRAIVRAMQPRCNDRPQTVKEFLKILNLYSNKTSVCRPPLNGDIDIDTIETTEIVTTDELDTKIVKTPKVDCVAGELKIVWGANVSSLQKQILGNLVQNMVFVHGGTFIMGADPNDTMAWTREKPVHSVTLSSYRVCKYQVTQREWQVVMGSNPSFFNDDNLPVENVSWDDCQNFVAKLKAMTGLSFRLPTEAEWEFASRGGDLSNGYRYSGDNDVDKVAWYRDNSSATTHPVGMKHPNELGLYDMSGNVYEWCSDIYGVYSDASQVDPTGATSGTHYVLRGGGWSGKAENCRVSYRDDAVSSRKKAHQGLRLAL